MWRGGARNCAALLRKVRSAGRTAAGVRHLAGWQQRRNILKAARAYGLDAKGVRRSTIDGLRQLKLPLIVFWNFNHFLVVEGFGKETVYLNDPAAGPRSVTFAEFNEAFTGVVLLCEPAEGFQKSGAKFNLIQSPAQAAYSLRGGVGLRAACQPLFADPGLVIPIFLRVFVDDILIGHHTSWITPLLIGMALVIALRAGLTWLQRMYLLRLETKLALSASAQFFWHVLRLPVEFFTQRYAGDIAFRGAVE